jgi:hypothetical protein
LQVSGKHLSAILGINAEPREKDMFEPPELRRLRTSKFDLYEKKLEKLFQDSGWVALADFEKAVHDHLDNWVGENLTTTNNRQRACEVLMYCLEHYSKASRMTYTLDPVDQSLADLTIVHLWTAIDRIAVVDVPLLKEFSPEVPDNFLAPLLLRGSASIRQSTELELYIRLRRQNAKSATSIFTSTPSADTFAARYFAQSQEMQDLQTLVREETMNRKEKKLEELEELIEKQERRREQIASHEHEFYTSRRKADNYELVRRHRPKCWVCREEREIEDMSIIALEDPLPEDEYTARMVIFELRCPAVFALWRSATYLVLSDLGLSERVKGSGGSVAKTLLSNAEGLENLGKFHEWSRLTLGSSMKRMADRYGGSITLPATKEQV